MQQDKNDIENKLRKLDSQQLPDLSRMDEHWQAMNQMLSRGADVPKGSGNFLKRNNKFLLFAASVITIIMLVWISQNRFADKGRETKDAGAINAPNASPKKEREENIVLVDTLGKPVSKKNILTSYPMYADRFYNQGDSTNIDQGNGDSADFFTDISSKPELKEVAKITLSNFYDQIQKQAQGFSLNAERGGSIKCSEGTGFIIPPAAFVDENGNSISGGVKIIILEYYKYSEMIAANLTTMSNGRQLITNGMVKITAEYKGKPVKLRSDKAIDIIMPTKNFDAAMQLFESASETNKISAGYTSDRLNEFASARYRNINWQLNGMQSTIPVFDGRANFLNMQDEPYKVSAGVKPRAKFAIPKDFNLTTEEVRKILTEKYGDSYGKIKVKRVRWVKTVPFLSTIKGEVRTRIGDSVRLTLNQAIRLNYIDKKDSAVYAERIKSDSVNFLKRYFAGMIFGDSIIVRRNFWGKEIITFRDRNTVFMNLDSLNKYYELYIKTQQTYSFRIKNLGWINCDRFSNYEDKTDFVINLPSGVKAGDFVSQLAFINIRSVLPGKTYENKIGFANVPVNMPVYLVGLGEKDGKVVSFMEKLKTGQNEVNITNFEETTTEAFKNKLAVLDLQ